MSFVSAITIMVFFSAVIKVVLLVLHFVVCHLPCLKRFLILTAFFLELLFVLLSQPVLLTYLVLVLVLVEILRLALC